MIGSVLLSPNKMKLLLLAILAAFGVCVNTRWLTLGLNNPIQGLTNLDWRRTEDESSSGRRAACGDCECDCQYFSGGCRVGKILQNTACNDHTNLLTLLCKSLTAFLDHITSRQREPCLSLRIQIFPDVYRHSS